MIRYYIQDCFPKINENSKYLNEAKKFTPNPHPYFKHPN